MSEIATPAQKPLDRLRANVRLTKEEYVQLTQDHMMSGKSIPWLLKTAYFKNRISAPNLDVETRKAVRRELSYIGNNLNQLAHNVNSGLIAHVRSEVQELLQAVKTLKSFLGRDYGDSQNSL